MPLSDPDQILRRESNAVDLANSSGRLISYVFSDTSVGRDNHVIAADAWQLDNFLRNPVFLWAHDADSPPIGRVIDIQRGQRLVGTVEYAERDDYPFADTIFRLTKAGYLNATSTSWIPREYKFSSDRSRPGGIDFSRVELLEISQVPVPALPTALATARAQGIDTGPIFDWAERLLDANNLAVLPRAELETLRQEARMPAGSRQQKRNAAAPPAPAVNPVTEPAPKLVGKRSLSHVGWLAYLLSELGYLQDCVAFEASIEEDNSPVPDQMLEALKSLGATLVAMTQEEVAELFAGDDEDDVADVIEMSAEVGARRAALSALVRLDRGAVLAVTSAMRLHLRGEKVTFTTGGPVTALARAGRVLSADNERCLREAHDHISRAADMVRGVFEQNDDEDDDESDDTDANDDGNDDGDDENSRAVRRRRAAALKLRIQTAG